MSQITINQRSKAKAKFFKLITLASATFILAISMSSPAVASEEEIEEDSLYTEAAYSGSTYYEKLVCGCVQDGRFKRTLTGHWPSVDTASRVCGMQFPAEDGKSKATATCRR